MRQINYFNSNGEMRSVDFNQAIKQWIEINGGINQVIREINTMNSLERESIHFGFIDFFTEKYVCKLPEYESDYFQSYLYEPQTYHQAIFNFQYEHNTRPTSGYNIALIVIMALALIGLISMCK
ncbi:MAG: hypothetical protein IT221_00600 [Fluviicola sp.]|nr:hypothetical protein [Fluviicola sp.]